MSDASGFRFLARLVQEQSVHFDPDRMNAVFLRGANDDPAVTAAEIVEHVAFFDFGQFEHFIDDFDRRRDKWDFLEDSRRGCCRLRTSQ